MRIVWEVQRTNKLLTKLIMSLGQIVFLSTGSWAEPIRAIWNESFVVTDKYTILQRQATGLLYSASLPLIGIPQNKCKKVSDDGRTHNIMWVSDFDTNNSGPVYEVHFANIRSLYFGDGLH